jgi:molybdate transport system substrate-binding protein
MKPTRIRRLRATGALTASLLVAPGLAACAGRDDEQQLTVFGAASLTEAFTSLADDFEKDHPDVDVKLSFGSSTDLATQVNEGSPADVLATADEKSMEVAADEGNIDDDPTQFATNTLIVVTPPDNPADITSVEDLADADYVVCDPSVPCGAAAATILDDVGVTAEPKSLEEDVKAVLTKVTTGEADAGIVYVTDANAAGDDVSTVDIPADANVVNPYVIGVLTDSDDGDLAQEWLDLVTSQAGQGVLSDAGFGPGSS